MDKQELLAKFCSLLADTKNSGKHEDIEVALCMFKKAVHLLSEVNLRNVKELIECYEGTLKYYNFLTESEAESILDKFSNQDGTKGARWKDPEEVFHRIEELGGRVECEPHYNKWALYVTMNKFSSDQNSVIVKWVGDDREKYFNACYELALTQLKDKDRLCWIRPYYSMGE